MAIPIIGAALKLVGGAIASKATKGAGQSSSGQGGSIFQKLLDPLGISKLFKSKNGDKSNDISEAYEKGFKAGKNQSFMA